MPVRTLGIICALFGSLCAVEPGSVSFGSPVEGDTLFVGDTITIRYEADQAYLDLGLGIELEYSVNGGEEWHNLPLVDTDGFPVFTDVELSGEFRAYIPEHLIVTRAGEQKDSIDTECSDAAFRMHPYQVSQPEGFAYGVVVARRAAANTPRAQSAEPWRAVTTAGGKPRQSGLLLRLDGRTELLHNGAPGVRLRAGHGAVLIR